MAQVRHGWAKRPNWGKVHIWAAVLCIYEILILLFPNDSHTKLQFPKRTLLLLFGATNYENRDFKAP